MSHKTDWLYNKKWGVFVHYLYVTQNNPLRKCNMDVGETDWNECVDSFDVDLLAKQLHEAGAGYLFVTLLQRKRFICAPNAAFDRITSYKPGEACSKRDLINDIYNALQKYDIDLMLYFTGDGPLDDPKAGPAMGYVNQADKVTLPYVKNWAEVAAEYSCRYGEKIKGWWVDGCYSFIGYDEEKLKIIADALRKGNPDTLISLNCGVEARVSAYSISDDFTTGEMNDFVDIPDQRFIINANGHKAQWHTLSFLGIPPDGNKYNGWCQPGSKYNGEYMREYVNKVHNYGGVVTIDVCLNRDGSIDKEQFEVLKKINT